MSGSREGVNKYKAHQILVKKTKLELQKEFGGKIRLFDRHVGKFTPLAFIRGVLDGRLSILDWGKSIVAINSKGMADVYGIISLHNILIHLEFEMKTGKAVQTKEQKDWQKMIQSKGGFYCLVRDEAQAIENLKHYLIERKLL